MAINLTAETVLGSVAALGCCMTVQRLIASRIATRAIACGNHSTWLCALGTAMLLTLRLRRIPAPSCTTQSHAEQMSRQQHARGETRRWWGNDDTCAVQVRTFSSRLSTVGATWTPAGL